MNNATSANGTGLPERCRVAEFAADARHLIDVFEFCDVNNEVEKDGRKTRALDDARVGIEDAASFFQTRSAVGAIFQIGLIWGICDSLAAELSTTKEGCERFRPLSDSVRRMCESITNFISQDEADRRAGCADYYMSMDGHHALIEAAATQASHEGRAAL